MAEARDTSGTGRAVHPTRCDVLRYELDRALTETPLTLEDFAEALAFAYHERVPAHARSLEIELPDLKGTFKDYSRTMVRLRKRVQRYVAGEVNLPCELEEAWCAALPEPYRAVCRSELARRYGFLGVRAPEAAACTDAEALGQVMTESGEALHALSRALADGRLDERDLQENPHLMRQVLDAEASLEGVAQRIRLVRSRGGGAGAA